MLTTPSSIFIARTTQPRKRARTLPRIALALATLASAGLFNTAHATYPGENGVIVFHDTAGGGVNRVSPGNSAVTSLAPGNSPSVSPNGKKIAFLSNDYRTLYVMNIDGSNIVELTKDQNLKSAAWLPDGSKVVYGRTVSDTVELWTINPDGSGKAFKRNLAPYAQSLGPLYLGWSPSGNNYTFFSGPGVYITDDLDPGARILAKDGYGSSWAPDGRSILISGWNSDQFEINPDGSNRRSVPPGGSPQSPSSISPDGKFIAGALYSSNGYEYILQTRARAGTPTTFTWNTVAHQTDWSRVPKNCYVSTLAGGGGVLAGDVDFYAPQCAIAVMPDDGLHGVLQQAIAVGPDQRLYHRALKTNPSGQPTWTNFMPVPGAGGSPNGIKAKKIAIAGAKDGSAQMVIINASDDTVYHAMRYANGTWSGFSPLGGFPDSGGSQALNVAITINASSATSPGNAQVIAINLNSPYPRRTFHRMRWADGSWTPFAMVPLGYPSTKGVAIAADENGNTDVLATTVDNKIVHVLRYSNGSWSDWTQVGLPAGTTLSESTDVAVTRTLSGTAQMMFTDATGNALYQERPTPDVLDSWKLAPPTVTIANTVGRAVSISAGATANSPSQMLITRTFSQ